MKTSTMTFDACKMMLVQNLVQGIGNAQNYEEVRRVLLEVQVNLPDDDEYEDEYIRSLDAPCDLPPYTVEELHEQIRQSEASMKAGLGTPHEEFMRELDEYVECL